MSLVMTHTENVEQICIQYASKVLKSGCALDNYLTSEQLSQYEFHSTQDTRDLLAGVLFVQKAEGSLLQIDISSQIL